MYTLVRVRLVLHWAVQVRASMTVICVRQHRGRPGRAGGGRAGAAVPGHHRAAAAGGGAARAAHRGRVSARRAAPAGLALEGAWRSARGAWETEECLQAERQLSGCSTSPANAERAANYVLDEICVAPGWMRVRTPPEAGPVLELPLGSSSRMLASGSPLHGLRT